MESIKEDVKWLGFEWKNERYASDYFDQLFEYAIKLIDKGLAYVDDSTSEEMAALKGSPTEPGKDSVFRSRTIGENKDLFVRMKNGEFPDGSRTLRAKIDMAHTNMLMRDPILYRIKHAHHHRTGDKWCIYPMYDFAHGLVNEVTTPEELLSYTRSILEQINSKAPLAVAGCIKTANAVFDESIDGYALEIAEQI